MSLREQSAFGAWVAAHNPSYVIGSTVEAWLKGLEVASWQAPSVPWPDDPRYRLAVVPESEGTVVFYFVEVNEPDQVDLIWIGPESDSDHLQSSRQ